MNAPLPILMHPGEIIGIKHAAHHAGRSVKTLRRWCHEYGIGRQPGGGGPLQVSAPALEMLLAEDFAALELLRAGRRDLPEVQRYFAHLGIAA